MKFTAVGDVLVQRRLPDGYDGFDKLKEFIMQGDARFFNLETTVNREGECYASQFSGGTYMRTEPEAMEDVLKFGFNITEFNNNHAMDYSYEGLIKTMEYVNKTGIVHSGVGMNLAQASAPCYLETPKGRVALISVNTTFQPPMMAGKQSERIKGRPGINGITVSQKLQISRDDFELLSGIAERSGINTRNEIIRGEGYLPQLEDGVGEFGSINLVVGDEPKLLYEASKNDVRRLTDTIAEAHVRSDYCMVSVHSHQIEGAEKETVPEFLKKLCRECIDAGADAIIGHGPHLLRAIEVYKNKPIFYCLGDFLMQLYDVAFAPDEMYSKYGMRTDESVEELLKKRSANYTRGLMEDVRMLETVIPLWETEGRDMTKLVLMPVTLSRHDGRYLMGLPRPSENTDFIDKLAKLSAPYGVIIKMGNDGLAHCSWGGESDE
ncbi:MAG: CapA family protein [Clostridia bacterium]|nr:CapA family protein [Clostridia bacterium]